MWWIVGCDFDHCEWWFLSVKLKGQVKTSSWWLHTCHLITKNTVRNGFLCNHKAKIHWQLPVLVEQISFLLFWSLSGPCSETQRYPRRWEVSAEGWQLGVSTQPQTKQHFGTPSEFPAHFQVQEKLKHQTCTGSLCQWSLFTHRHWNHGHCPILLLMSLKAKPHCCNSFQTVHTLWCFAESPKSPNWKRANKPAHFLLKHILRNISPFWSVTSNYWIFKSVMEKE